jgi:DNA-binding GntR family transcriptional regulator
VYTAPHTSLNTRSTRRVLLSAHAYTELKHRLLVGDFPLGQRLAETALAELLEVSRTPVREALSRLHAEGLVEPLPDGGFAPVAPDLHSISELYEIRRSLEFAAIGRGGHDRDALEGLRDDWASMVAPGSDDECGPDFVLLDESFHVRLARASGNLSLVDFLVGVNERIRIVRMHDFLTADRVTKTITEHHRIVSHLLDRRTRQARDALSRHLEISERVVEQRAAVALSRMLGRHRHV